MRLHRINIMVNLRISDAVLQKLRDKHNVTRREVEQCFENKCGLYLEDLS